MIENNIPLEMIKITTGLSDEEIKKFKKKLRYCSSFLFNQFHQEYFNCVKTNPCCNILIINNINHFFSQFFAENQRSGQYI